MAQRAEQTRQPEAGHRYSERVSESETRTDVIRKLLLGEDNGSPA